MSTQAKPDHAAYVTRLASALDDKHRGDRAALRRYWSPTTRHQAFPVLGNLGALGDDRKTILCALFAEHPLTRPATPSAKPPSFWVIEMTVTIRSTDTFAASLRATTSPTSGLSFTDSSNAFPVKESPSTTPPSIST